MYSVPTPQYGQYLTHAHNHITPAMAAMDNYFVLVRTYQVWTVWSGTVFEGLDP